MTHGSLFSGIGGFDLAAEWMGWENKFHCEWNEFGQKILNYYWPMAESYGDITKTDFAKWRGKIDIVSGGFPCQPYSLAGKRKGKDDDRHLWPEMLRAIREIQPRWVVGENVFGLVNWSGGLVFHEVQADLEAAGYEVWPYVLPACGVNAPHRRDRIWFVAKNTNKNGRGGNQREGKPGKWQQWDVGAGDNVGIRTNNAETWPTPQSDHDGRNGGNGKDEKLPSKGGKYAQRDAIESISTGDAADTKCFGSPRKKYREKKSGFNPQKNQGCGWANFPTEPPVCTGNDGFPTNLDGITFSKWRNQSIMAAGNAVVPQVVLQIFKSIEVYENIS